MQEEKQWLVDQLARLLGKPEGQEAAAVLAFTRRYLGFSIKVMAGMLQVDKSAVSNYEYRVIEPSYRYLIQVIRLVKEMKDARPRGD